MIKSLSIGFSNAVNLLFPGRCIICGKSTSNSSHSELDLCYDRIVLNRTNINEKRSSLFVCNSCLMQFVCIGELDRWNFCLSNPIPNDPYPELALYMCFPYEGIMRRAITNMKFRGKYECGFLLGLMLGKCLKDDGVNIDLIIPIPLHSKRYKERGYNQAELIAYSVGKMLNKPVITDALIRTNPTSRQSEIKDVNERISNVKDAFKVSDNWDLSDSTVLLIDDVVTTGFTIHEAALALLNSGAKKVLCSAVAGNRLIKNADRF